MPLSAAPCFLANVYESQHRPWHPFGLPARLMDAPRIKARLMAQQAPDGAAPSMRSLPKKMAFGAREMVNRPLALALSLPVPVVFLGTTAPLFSLAGSGAFALVTGTGGLCMAQQPNAAPTRPPQGALRAVLAYGLLGCVTELLSVKLARLGKDMRRSSEGDFIHGTLGYALEIVGYTAAIVAASLLLIPRLMVAGTWALAIVAAMPFAAAAGGLWAAMQHTFEAYKARLDAPAAPPEPQAP